MQKVKLFFTRKQGADDIIQFYDDELYVEMIRIVYTPGDHAKKSHEFYMTRSGVYDYLDSVLVSMEYDAEPFEFFQIQTAIHPSVMIPVADLSCRRARTRVVDMVEQALRANIEEIALKQTVRSPVGGY